MSHQFHMSHRLRKPNQLGFTMIEMMVGIAILGILAALAAPDFSATIKRYRIKSTADELRASFLLARSTAITRGQPVIIQSTGLVKDNDWSCGWEMFVDANSNNTRDIASEPLMQVTTAQAGYTLTRTTGTSTLMTHRSLGSANWADTNICCKPARGAFRTVSRTLFAFSAREEFKLKNHIRQQHQCHMSMKKIPMKSKRFHKLQRGLSLIESLIALVVLAVGVMGLAGVQARMLVESRTANHRAVAIGFIDDLSNRMLLNRDAAMANNYALAWGATKAISCQLHRRCSTLHRGPVGSI
jgi:type IV fimbrial biogenesis protein FimT